MADKEKNLPIQDPENLDNEIQNTESSAEETVNEAPVVEEPIAETVESLPEEGSDLPEVEVPAEEAGESEAGSDEPDTEPAEETEPESEGKVGEPDETEDGEASEESDEGVYDDSLEIIYNEEDSDGELAVNGYKIGVSEEGELYVRPPVVHKIEEAPNQEEAETETEDEPEVDEPVIEPLNDVDFDEEFIDPDDLVIHDEVTDAIRAEGSKLVSEDFAVKAYLKHSKIAVKNLEAALKMAQRALEANRDDREAPAIMVSIIKICGKILEVKCDNLENLTRVKAHGYIREAKRALHYEIDRYNEYVINYASITGEQLTRLSTFLPENIAAGKSLAVVPSLNYVETYVQISDEEKGKQDSGTIVIAPAVSADDFIGDVPFPKGKGGCASFARRVKRGTKRINRYRTELTKLISKNAISRKRYESEIASLNASTPVAVQATQEYKDKVFAIGMKYTKRIIGLKSVKTESAFARTRLSLVVRRMALEREKLVLAYELMRVAYREGSASQRRDAKRSFERAIDSYNQSAEATSKATGTLFEQLPVSLVELSGRGEEITFPAVAYKRQLVERVGDSARLISMALKEDIAPDEQGFAENSGKILDKQGSMKDTNSLSEESAMVDRASAIAKVMLESLKESADMVLSADELRQFEVKSQRATKYFKRALKATNKAISRAFDENGVITALVENLRVIANLIEVRRLNIAVATRLGRKDAARSYGRSLYKYIELYNGRAIDYMSIVGEQFSRITTATSKELIENADKLKVPVITYKDNYLEVFPKDPLKDSTYEKPRLWRKGVYTPLMMHHFRLTENRSVETTVVNAPFVFDVMTDSLPTVSWWHPIGFWQHFFVWTQPIIAWWNRVYTNAEIWFVDESLIFSKSGLKGRQNRAARKKSGFEAKLRRLNEEHRAKLLELETVVHDSDRNSATYQQKLYKINSKYNRKIYNLKVRWMRECTGRNEARMLLERLVLERERITGINNVMLKYRNYGRITFTPNVLVRYKKRFIDAINAHNKTAEKLSELIGVQFSQVSTSVAEEIIRYGKFIKFPEIVCCREIIETVDGQQRTVGDRWHGYGLYTGTTGAGAVKGNPPIMSVGAMGYATDMGVPFLKADFEGMTMLGMTPGGVPLIGFSQTGETSIPFTGIPMMLTGADSSVVLDAGMEGQDSLILGAASVADPHSGISRRAIDSEYIDEAEEDAKDIHSGCSVETPLDLEAKMIEERFTRALRARAMTSVDGVANWWKLLGSEINVWLMRKLAVRPHGFLRAFLPPRDPYLEIVNTKVSKNDVAALCYIARVGGIIEIECKRLYSAAKTGVRRSQRVWSAWLHEDIEVYNKLVREFNSNHERYMHLEPLSLNIPDTIRFRTEDRPPVPPILSLRNRVKLEENVPQITTDDLYNKILEYARTGSVRYASGFQRFWAKHVTIPRIKHYHNKGNKAAVLTLASKIILKRSARTYLHRQDNENRHYRIRYEKSRAMRRYNRRTIRAIGVANDPIKYQTRMHKVLRRYLKTNFRIDYNMRIRQLIYRALTIERGIFWSVTVAMIAIVSIAAIFFASRPALQIIVMIALGWAALPIVLLLLRIVYEIVMFIASVVLLVTRNIWLIKYGARDVERNRYGAILDCFVNEQYRLLVACEKLKQKPKSGSAKKMLIATVNDYNKRAKVYSEMLRVPIREIETTSLIEKLISGETHPLYEIQNFVYVRELVERVDVHQRGKTLKDHELDTLVAEINGVINGINLTGSENQVAVDFLQGAMQKLIAYIQSGVKPTQNERFELKRDLIQAIDQFDITPGNRELFSKNVIKVVDQLGGKDSRRIIGIVAEDDMII